MVVPGVAFHEMPVVVAAVDDVVGAAERADMMRLAEAADVPARMNVPEARHARPPAGTRLQHLGLGLLWQLLTAGAGVGSGAAFGVAILQLAAANPCGVIAEEARLVKIAELVLLPGTLRQQTSQTALRGIGNLSSPVNHCCLGFLSIRVVGLFLVWPRCVRQPTYVWHLQPAVRRFVSPSQVAHGLCERSDQSRSEKCCKHLGSLRSHCNRKGTMLAICY